MVKDQARKRSLRKNERLKIHSPTHPLTLAHCMSAIANEQQTVKSIFKKFLFTTNGKYLGVWISNMDYKLLKTIQYSEKVMAFNLPINSLTLFPRHRCWWVYIITLYNQCYNMLSKRLSHLRWTSCYHFFWHNSLL